MSLTHYCYKHTNNNSYVAVTGLPQPQPNHALLMVKFARDCLVKVPKVLKKLAPTLGPDTNNLAMRVGLHSGPVTAGVLRGEKARFQVSELDANSLDSPCHFLTNI